MIAPVLETRQAILNATDKLMQRFGFRKMTMDDVAREAGIGKRTIYTYFSSKEELGLSSIERVVEFAQARMRSERDSGGDSADRLLAMLVGRVMARVESVRDYRQSLDELFEAVRPAYMERRKRNFEVESRLIEEVLSEGQADGDFEFIDAKSTAEALLRSTNAYLPYSLSVAELGDLEAISAGVETLARILIRGLRPRVQP